MWVRNGAYANIFWTSKILYLFLILVPTLANWGPAPERVKGCAHSKFYDVTAIAAKVQSIA